MSSKRPLVLLDGEQSALRFLADVGRSVDADPIPFSEPERARRWLEENPVPGAVVIDLRVVGGGPLCREMRFTPRLASVPILATAPADDGAARELAFDVSALFLGKPFAREVVRETLARSLASTPGGRWTDQPRVLIVDDDQGFRAAVKRVVEDQGWEALCAANAEEAMALLVLGRPAPSLALIDVMMPGIDGVALARRMRRAVGAGDMPVVIVSASPDVAVRAQTAGAVAHLKKPFQLDDLVALMHEAVILGGATL